MKHVNTYTKGNWYVYSKVHNDVKPRLSNVLMRYIHDIIVFKIYDVGDAINHAVKGMFSP